MDTTKLKFPDRIWLRNNYGQVFGGCSVAVKKSRAEFFAAAFNRGDVK